MRRIVPAVVILGSMLGFSTSASMAMGFGRVDNATVLGHPLDFNAGINIDTDEWIAQECVAAEVLSGDNKLAPAQVRVRLSAPTQGTRPTVAEAGSEEERLPGAWLVLSDTARHGQAYFTEQVILHSLRFSSINSRHESISKEHSQTFSWIFDTTSSNKFVKWFIKEDGTY